MSIFALSLLPFLAALVLAHLVSAVSPRHKALWHKDKTGDGRLSKYVLFATAVFCAIQSYGLSVGLESFGSPEFSAVLDPGAVFRLTMVVTLTAGTLFLVWLAEQITRRGIGNGIALILCAGIVANLPLSLAGLLNLGRTGAVSGPLFFFVISMPLALAALIVFMETARRQVVIQYDRSKARTLVPRDNASHVKILFNGAGVAGPLLAVSILALPLSLIEFSRGFVGGFGAPTIAAIVLGEWSAYFAAYAGLVFTLSLYCSKIHFDSTAVAHDLNQNGGIIPGFRPGKITAAYLNRVQTRLATIGAIYLTVVCVLPDVFVLFFALPLPFAGLRTFVAVMVVLWIFQLTQSHVRGEET